MGSPQYRVFGTMTEAALLLKPCIYTEMGLEPETKVFPLKVGLLMTGHVFTVLYYMREARHRH